MFPVTILINGKEKMYTFPSKEKQTEFLDFLKSTSAKILEIIL